jgi:heme-degrading monooxygenase HmoA
VRAVHALDRSATATGFYTHIKQANYSFVRLYFNTYVLHSRWEDKIFWSEWQQTSPKFNLLLIYYGNAVA